MDEKLVKKYKSPEGAARYNVKYEAELHKRISTKREFKVIKRCFEMTSPPHKAMLDAPVGVARLYPAYKEFTQSLHAADVSLEMLKFARENAAEIDPTLAQMSAFHMPYKDRSIPLIFSCRLAHHIPDDSERNLYLSELMRIADQWIIMTYFNYHSLKNVLRRVRAPFNKKKPKITMKRTEFRAIVKSHGWEVISTIPLSRMGSGHDFCVLRRS